MKPTIVIMAKVPRAGNVKTRLQPFLSPEQCAELSEAFLEDTINKARKVCDKVIIAFSPIREREYFDKFAAKNLILVEQTGENLGEKMFNAFDFAFKRDSDSVVMIGTDSPTFPVEFIEQAFNYLEKADVVLGKTKDGGFYLIGLQALRKNVFENVEWSSTETFAQTVRNIKEINLIHSLLPLWFDVDFPADLKRLRKELMKNSHLAPKTFEWLKDNFRTAE
ncbi:MAG: TIGR04282 family arsenosugar biosynthesis glycosyltransferase [Pyrinomonadaceae bacterium]